MRFIILIITLTFSGFSFSITPEEVIEKMQKVQNASKQLSFSSTFELFKGHKSTEVHSSYTGEFYRNEEGTYQKIKNTEFIYGNDYFLQVSHGEKAMVLGRAQENINQQVDVSELLKSTKELKLNEESGTYEVVILYDTDKPTVFSVVKCKINTKTFHLEQIDLYYRMAQDFSTSFGKKDMHSPHLRIKMKNIKSDDSIERPELLKLSTYITKKNKVLIPTGSCSGYELIDNR